MNDYDIEYLNIKNNLEEYDFSYPYEKVGEKIIEMNEYASNIENIFPVRCSCGKVMSDMYYDTLIKKGNSHEEARLLLKNRSKEQLVKIFYNNLENDRISQDILDRIEYESKFVIKMCCGNSLLSPVPIENIEASTVAISSGEVKKQMINNIKQNIAKQIAERIKKNEPEISIKNNYVDMYGVNFSNYTDMEKEELLNMAKKIAFN